MAKISIIYKNQLLIHLTYIRIKMSDKLRDKEYNENLTLLFRAEDWEDRAKAARNLGHMKDGRAVNLLIKALKKEKDEAVKDRIIEAMGRIGHPKATQSILEILEKELKEEVYDKNRLFIIIESLMKLGDKRALIQLGIVHKTCDADIKALTEEAFECIDPNWRENLKKAQE